MEEVIKEVPVLGKKKGAIATALFLGLGSMSVIIWYLVKTDNTLSGGI